MAAGQLTRRHFGALAAAAALTPTFARAASVLPPAIIAEGGAAEERPIDTRSALDQAITEGCDYIQVNLFPAKDGALVARRENELSASTDIDAHPEFAARKTTKTIAGADVSGWFIEDFTIAELKTLLCREPNPAMHPQTVRYAGKEPLLTLAEVLQLARDGCVRTARTVGVCARISRVKAFADMDLHVDELLATELQLEGYIADAAAVWVQSDEPEALINFGRLSPIRRMQIIEVGNPQVAQMTSAAGLAQIKSWAEAIAPDQDLVLDPAGATFPTPTTLAMDAHSAGLQLYSRNARVENAFLPPAVRRGDARSASYPNGHGDIVRLMTALFANGVDGLATDQVNAASRARDAAIQALQQRQGSSNAD